MRDPRSRSAERGGHDNQQVQQKRSRESQSQERGQMRPAPIHNGQQIVRPNQGMQRVDGNKRFMASQSVVEGKELTVDVEEGGLKRRRVE